VWQCRHARWPSDNRLVHASPRLRRGLPAQAGLRGALGEGAGHRFARLSPCSRGVVNRRTLSEMRLGHLSEGSEWSEWNYRIAPTADGAH
jgi:hypothetical protein